MSLRPNKPVDIVRLGGAVRALAGPAGTLPQGPLDVPPSLGNKMGVRLASDMRNHFQLGRSPKGQAWAPIKPRPQGGDKPLLNTGKLRNSITGRAEPHGASAGTNAIQANLMNEGGTIKPKRAKMLAIPLTREAVRSGGPRKFPRNLFVIRTKSGSVLLVEAAPKTKKGKIKKRKLNASEQTIANSINAGADVHAHYLLVRSATIPARPFNGFSDECMKDVSEYAMRYVLGLPIEGDANA